MKCWCGEGLAEIWHGRTWRAAAVPAPGGRNVVNGSGCFDATAEWLNGGYPDCDGLTGVSCLAASSCFASAAYPDRGVPQDLAEHWNGRKWRTVVPPMPSSYEFGELAGMSCATDGTDECVALGYGFGPTGGANLDEVWR